MVTHFFRGQTYGFLTAELAPPCCGTQTVLVTKTVCLSSLFIFLLFFYPVAAKESKSKNYVEREPLNLKEEGRAKSKSFEHVFFEEPMATNISQSKSFIIKFGDSAVSGFSPQSQNWRWYDDEEKKTPKVALAGENVTPVDIEDGNIIKLRFTLKETAGVAGKDIKFKLQFSRFSDFSEEIYDVSEMGDCVRDSSWCYADGAGRDNHTILGEVLSDSDKCLRGGGKGCGTHNESGVTESSFKHKKNTAVEYEFTIKSSGAEENRTYFFRAVEGKNEQFVPPASGSNFPSIVTSGARLIFAISGLATSTPTEGIITDRSTTPQQIAFGLVPFNQGVEAAQRLAVTTNARRGYKIFVLERQGLLDSDTKIDPVPGTNGEPREWFLSEDAESAYGYHAGDDTLSGGSTRFAPNNSYAHFGDGAAEIGFNSSPVVNELTDIIFKLQVTEGQEAGEYAGAVVYIVAPTF